MIPVLIVDDEKYVRQRILTRIDWKALGLTVAGEADNGRSAMSFLSSCPVQIVITDIKMPLMDGIELIRQTRSLYPSMFFIILSGFPDFQYAKTALQLGVKNFIEKPIDMEELSRTLAEIAQSINQKEPAVPDKLTYRQLIEAADDLGLLRHRDFVMSALQYFDGPKPDLSPQLLQAVGRQYQAQAVYHFTVPNIPSSSFLLFCFSQPSKLPLEAVRRIYQWPEQASGPVRMAIASSDAQNFTSLYYQALTGLKQQLFDPSQGEAEFSAFGEHLHFLQKSISQENYSAIPQALKRINKLHPLTLSMGEALVFELCGQAQKLASQSPQSLLACGNLSSPYLIVNSKTREDFFAQLAALCQDIFPVQSEEESKNPFRQICEYIQANYMEDLTLEEISKRFYLSPTYLSALFKKQAGLGISQYIEQLRIDRAKALLQEDTLPISDIALFIGYNDPNYFGKVFRKYTGISPSKYRTIHLQGEGAP